MTKILDFSEVNEKQKQKYFMCIFHDWKNISIYARITQRIYKVPRIARKHTATLSIPKVLVIAK